MIDAAGLAGPVSVSRFSQLVSARSVPSTSYRSATKRTEEVTAVVGLASIREISGKGTTILVVEQNATMALSVAHRGYVLKNGRIVAADTAAALLASNDVRRAYLGGK